MAKNTSINRLDNEKTTLNSLSRDLLIAEPIEMCQEFTPTLKKKK